MIARRILRSASLYACRTSRCEFNVCRNFFNWKESLKPVCTVKLARVIKYESVQHYAMDKPRRAGKKKIEVREDILGEYFNVEKIKLELNDVVEYMKEQLLENVSIRSTAGVIESIPIVFEGEHLTIRDLAQVNRKNPKLVVLNFSAFPQTIPTVLQTLEESGLNLNPQQDGTTISIPIPKVTREYREKLAKSVNAIFVKCKAAVKEVQMKFAKKLDVRTVNEKISVEQMRIVNDQLVILANQYIAELEKIKNDKINELLRNE